MGCCTNKSGVKHFVKVKTNQKWYLCDPLLERQTNGIPHFKYFLLNRQYLEAMHHERYEGLDTS